MIDWARIQNADGGWAYGHGGSWTEPTVFALLAQSAPAPDRSVFNKGIEFLRSTQRQDGGWSPRPGVDQSTWVTSLAALLPEDAIGGARLRHATSWLLGQAGQESSWSWKLSQWLHGNRDRFPEGMPWFPGAAAWVTPTSMSVLAFERAAKRGEDARLRARVRAGQQFLIEHMCADGGWNHGSNKALGRDGDSYPETTGIALLALHSSGDRTAIERGKAAARRHLATCRTAEGTSWLRMALAAHGEPVVMAFEATPRTTLDAALMTLASAGRNPLL